MKIDSPEKESMRLVEERLNKEYRKVINVSKRGGEYGGFDFLCEDESGNKVRVEVKGTTVEYGIPSPYHTEFVNGKMTADFMYVIYFPREIDWNSIDKSLYGSKVIFYKIPREAIIPEYLKEKKGWIISGKFKKKNKMGEYIKNFSVEQVT
ncbi:MAG: hypothetical protein AABX65_02965 [Nanoarchaeota archaeon]